MSTKKKKIMQFADDNVIQKKYLDFCIITGVFFVGVYLNYGFKDIFAALIVLWLYLNHSRSDIFAKLGLFLLLFVPIVIGLGRHDKVIQIVTLVYGSFALCALMLIIESRRKGSAKE